MLFIDGAYGEGGGQILRTSLALSVILGRSVHLENIRKKRSRPGLRPQHLACVKALAEISGAEVRGAEVGSTTLSFCPRGVKAGEFVFDIGTAGSTMLLLQAVLIPLFLTGRPSRLILRGGTHVPWSPCYHYVDRVFRPVMVEMGIEFQMVLKQWGWYPRGGGEVVVQIKGGTREQICGFSPKPHGNIPGVRVLSCASGLPKHVVDRQMTAMEAVLRAGGVEIVEKEKILLDHIQKGSMAFAWIQGPGHYGGYFSLGRPGLRAEKVGEEAGKAITAFLRVGADCDEHLSDQLVLPASIGAVQSAWTTSRMTSHLATNLWVVERFGLTTPNVKAKRPG